MIRQKLVGFVLALFVVLSMMPFGLARGDPPAQFEVYRPGYLPRAGETFSVSVVLTNNPGFCAVQATLRFDRNVLECSTVSLGPLLSGVLSASNPDDQNGATVAAATLDAVKEDGLLAVYTFTAKANVTVLELELEVVSFTGENGKPFDYGITLFKEGAIPDQTPKSPQESSEKPMATGDPRPETEPTEPPDDPLPPKYTFSDIQGHWGESYILRAAEMGSFGGYPDGTFRPDIPVSRAQFVTVLWRMAGTPEPLTEKDIPFVDIGNQSGEFQQAIRWAYEKGVVYGTSPITFSPESPLTRQEALTVLYRYSTGSMPGMEIMFTEIYDSTFTDSGQIEPWAKPAMYWGVYHQIISGTGEKTLSPQRDTTRAQLAKIMVDHMERFAKTGDQGGESK